MAQRIDHPVEKLPGPDLLPIQAFGEGKIDAGRGFEGFCAEPGFNGGTAPVRGDQADGDPRKEFSECFAKIIGRSAEIVHVCGGAGLPFARAVFLRFGSIVAGDRKHPDERGGPGLPDGLQGSLDPLMVPTANGHFHIGLSTADPDFANQHMVQAEFVAVTDADAVGAAGIGRVHQNAPVSGLIGSRTVSPAIPGGFHPDSRCPVRRSPDHDPGIPLKDHAVSQQTGKSYFRLGAGGQNQQHGQDGKKPFHHSIAKRANAWAGIVRSGWREAGTDCFSRWSV